MKKRLKTTVLVTVNILVAIHNYAMNCTFTSHWPTFFNVLAPPSFLTVSRLARNIRISESHTQTHWVNIQSFALGWEDISGNLVCQQNMSQPKAKDWRKGKMINSSMRQSSEKKIDKLMVGLKHNQTPSKIYFLPFERNKNKIQVILEFLTSLFYHLMLPYFCIPFVFGSLVLYYAWYQGILHD